MNFDLFVLYILIITVRKLLIDDPEFIFPVSLQQVTLYRRMQAKSDLHTERAKKQMKVGSHY
jgi:hypothetical protein